MDPAYLSALAALAGSLIGGLTSFATAWMTQRAQTEHQRLHHEREKREVLYGRFLDEAAKVYADALQNAATNPSVIIPIYALANRIRLISSSEVVDGADRALRTIVDTYFAPNRTQDELRVDWAERGIDPLRAFSEACREELRVFRRL